MKYLSIATLCITLTSACTMFAMEGNQWQKAIDFRNKYRERMISAQNQFDIANATGTNEDQKMAADRHAYHANFEYQVAKKIVNELKKNLSGGTNWTSATRRVINKEHALLSGDNHYHSASEAFWSDARVRLH
jgi:predicted transcriptional regulator